MKEKLNRKIAVILMLVFLFTFPTDMFAQHTRQGEEQSWCKFWNRTGALAGANAFVFGLIPGLQPVGIAFGAYALGSRLYTTFSCQNGK